LKSLRLSRFHKYGTGILILCLVLTGCVSTDFKVETLAKTDVNVVSDIHIQQTAVLLKRLTRKLYKMNSRELAKTPGATVDRQLSQLFQCPPPAPSPLINQKTDTQALLLTFDPEYTGDRVYAMIYGLTTMLHKAYDENCDTFMLDFLNAQNLYNAARNIEILVWRLKTRRKADGRLFLTTNICDGPIQNLSYERLFGKLISLQDTMALIISTRTNRIITEVVHTAGMTFLPVGL